MTDPQLPDSQVISISEWISSRLWVDYGVPFAFDGRPYLRKIHDLDEKKILFRTGRQVEKTSSLAAKLVSHSCMRTNWKSLYVSPSQGQTRVFSHARLDRVLQSPYVKAKYFNSEQCIDFVYEKQFMNGSSVLLSYASTDADRCRGISADMLLCFDRNTLVLTRTGWRRVDLLSMNDEVADIDEAGVAHWHKPTALTSRKYSGRMITFRHRKAHVRVTQDHKMWANWKLKSSPAYKTPDLWEFVKAGDLAFTDRMGFKFKMAPDSFVASSHENVDVAGRSYPAEAIGALIGWYLAEGSLGRDSYVCIDQKPGAKLDEIIGVVKSCSLEYFVTGKKCRRVHVKSKSLNAYLRPLGNSFTKHLPRELFELPRKAVLAMLRGLYLGDGMHHPGQDWDHGTLKTRSKRLAEDTQELWLRVGRPASITAGMARPSNFKGYDYSHLKPTPIYLVTAYKRDYAVFLRPQFSKKIQIDEVADEEVFCLSVPHHRVIVKGSYSSPPIITSQCDEIQDMTTDVFPVLEQCLSHSPWGYKVYAGTPKTLNNSMETHWKNSTQCEWMIHCGGCGKWIFQDEKMIRKEGPRCPDCSRELDPQFGKWVAYGAEDSEFVGFRIPQTMVPWMLHPHKWKELYQNFTKWPQQQFYNEVLGLAHERGANPLVEEDLKKCCSDRTMVEHRPVDLYFDALYAGVDWGAGLGSYTVLFILGWHGGKVHVLYARRFAAEKDEPGIQVDEIAKTCARFATPLVACDWGGGFAQNKSLAMQLSGHGDVVQMCESGVKKRDLSYIQASRMYTFNRSMGMSMVIQGIKNGDYVFPRWEDFKDFAPDFINIFEDYNRALRQIVYDHPDNSPDDAMHSLMFATLAMKLARGDKAL